MNSLIVILACFISVATTLPGCFSFEPARFQHDLDSMYANPDSAFAGIASLTIDDLLTLPLNDEILVVYRHRNLDTAQPRFLKGAFKGFTRDSAATKRDANRKPPPTSLSLFRNSRLSSDSLDLLLQHRVKMRCNGADTAIAIRDVDILIPDSALEPYEEAKPLATILVGLLVGLVGFFVVGLIVYSMNGGLFPT